jgi:hypothetical protein
MVARKEANPATDAGFGKGGSCGDTGLRFANPVERQLTIPPRVGLRPHPTLLTGNGH